jgi:poly(A) polymerase
MTHHLAAQPWLTDPATQAVIAALHAKGGPGCVRFVGGCVRNAVIGEPVSDIDLATTLQPEVIVAALKAAGLKAVPTGIDHGTITAISGRKPFEITTLRRDVSTDGRRAVVAFTDDWAEDAARRDFRLNALYAEPDGRIVDPTGQGVDDALSGRIIFVGDARPRIREDYLRILRFFRFLAWYGRGEPDSQGLEACADLVEGVDQLSAERVSKELLKLLAAPRPVAAVRLMHQAGVLQRIVLDPDLDLFQAMVSLTDDEVLRLSALAPADPAGADRLAVRLRLSNGQKARLIEAVTDGPSVSPAMDERAARVALYRLGRRAFEDRLLRATALEGGSPLRLLGLAQSWKQAAMPVGGRDLAAAGVAAGPDMGRILTAFEDSWIADDFPTTGHDARLRSLI